MIRSSLPVSFLNASSSIANPNLLILSRISNPNLQSRTVQSCSRFTTFKPSFSSKPSSDSNHLRPKVLYRGPAPLKVSLYYFCALAFGSAGLSVGLMVKDHLSWPLLNRNPDNPPELLQPMIRYVAGFGTMTIGGVFAWMFFWIPANTVTRVVLHPASRSISLRSASRSLTSLLPPKLLPKPILRSLNQKGLLLPNHHPLEKVVPLSSLWRVDGSASKFGGSKGAKKAILLRVGTSKFGYSLESSAPLTTHELKLKELEEKSLYRKGWNWLMFKIRGKTDWGLEPEGTIDESLKEKSRREQKSKSSGGNRVDKDPWYSDRKLFDQLIPNEKERPM